MMTRLFFGSLISLFSSQLLAAGAAVACTCLPADVATSFTSSTDVAIMTIKARKERGHTIWYAAKPTRVIKGCTTRGDTVLLRTPASSATCGLTNLEEGRSYLINGDFTGSLRGRDVLWVSLCDYNLPVEDLSRSDVSYLRRNAEECIPLTCDDLAGEDFGMCEMVLGYGVVNGACQAVSGCSLPDDIVLAETFEECEEVCHP